MRLSHSALSTYKKCPRKFQFRYVDKVKVERVPSPAMERGLSIHQGIENFFLSGGETSLPELAEDYREFFLGLMEFEFTPEHKWGLTADFECCDFNDEEAILRGVIDGKCVSDTLNLYEFKTGKFYKDHFSQMNLYGMQALIEHPDFAEVTVHSIYLDNANYNKSLRYPRGMLKEYQGMWRRGWEEAVNDEVYMPQPQYGCRWCEFSRANGGPCQF